MIDSLVQQNPIAATTACGKNTNVNQSITRISAQLSQVTVQLIDE